MMTPFLAALGVVVVIIAIVLGLLVGEVDRVLTDDEAKRRLEADRVERERQQAWKDKWK